MIKNNKKVFITLHFIEHVLILAFTITGCILISAFTSLFGIPLRIMSSAIGSKLQELKSIVSKI